MLLEPLNLLPILVTLVFFALGSYYDLKTREVPDKVWLMYAPIGIALTAGHFLVDPSALFLAGVSLGLTTLIAFGLFYLGLFGGADAKALLCLGVTMPLAPSTYQTFIGYVHPFFPLVVTITSYLCSTSAVIWLGLRNLDHYIRHGEQMFKGLNEESRWKKALACVTGFPIDQSKLRSTFYLYPMEEVVQADTGSHRKFKLFVSAEEDREQEISKLENQLSQIGYTGEVWVTPGLPQLVFITLAFIITLIIGDPIFGTAMKLAVH